MYNEKTIEKLKQKILDLAIRGKLVPQDPNDEPASILIEKIRKEKEKLIKEGKIKKPKEDSFIFKGSDNLYYENYFKVGDILEYEQPGPYIVKNTDYNDSFDIPVLTPGKTFILGYTNEKDGIYKADKNNKVIIFDDFTTASRLVDFNFKVKSSAMKILKVTDSSKFDIEYIYYLLQTIHIIVDTHKRFWISEYIPLLVSIPSLWYQKIVAHFLSIVNNKLTSIEQGIEKLNNTKNNLKQIVLSLIFSPNSSYKSYYENEFNLGDILKYEQPGPYIVKNTNYNDSFDMPVLTPGKTFILGYTDEKDGIYKATKDNKVIIFDDFTTVSRLVDFDFKIKSSAMKILHISDKSKFDIEYMYYLLQTINIIVDTHKRFWISEYAPLKVRIHTYDEQIRIKNKIKSVFETIDNL